MSDAHNLLRMSDHMERQRARNAAPLPTRLGIVMAAARALSHAGTAQTGEGSRTKPTSRQPPPINSLQYAESKESVFDHYERRLKLMIAAYEREVDAAKQRPIEADLRFTETKQEREQRLIVDFEGIHSAEVYFIDRSFGSPKSIERTRSKLGRSPTYGHLQ